LNEKKALKVKKDTFGKVREEVCQENPGGGSFVTPDAGLK